MSENEAQGDAFPRQKALAPFRVRDQGATEIFVGNNVLATLDLVVPRATTVHDQKDFSEGLLVVNDKNNIFIYVLTYVWGAG